MATIPLPPADSPNTALLATIEPPVVTFKAEELIFPTVKLPLTVNMEFVLESTCPKLPACSPRVIFPKLL